MHFLNTTFLYHLFNVTFLKILILAGILLALLSANNNGIQFFLSHSFNPVIECEFLHFILDWRESEAGAFSNDVYSTFDFSYMDTEQFDEAVRDYEKICKMDKTRGMYWREGYSMVRV